MSLLTVAQIQQAYVVFFGRPADAAGLQFWQGFTGGLPALYATFAQQPEYAAQFGGLTAQQQVALVYRNLLGREPDLGGLVYWTGELQAGRVTVANLALSLANGAQGTDIQTIQSRVTAATNFTAALDTVAERLGYDGAAANASARDWLSGVTHATPAANLAGAAVDTAVAATVAAGTAAINVGQTFWLTAGAENVIGTAGNDTINALAVKADGAFATTFSAFDNIDGGAGTDTLNIYTTADENTGFTTAATVKNVEVVNIYNTAAAAAFGDASKFEGATQLWQHAAAVDVTKLAATTTAGFKAVEATVAADLDVSAAAAATTVMIALDGVKGDAATGVGTIENRADIDVDGAALAGVTVSGTLAQKTTASAGAAEVFTATFAGGAALNETVIFDGRTYTSAGGLTATEEATAFVTAYNNVAATWTAVDNLNGTVTFTKKTVGVVTDAVSGDFTGTAAAQVTAAAATVQGAAASTTAAAASLALNVTAGKDVESLTVNTAVATTLTVIENGTSAASKDIRTLDASASAGAVTFGGSVTGGTAGSLATIKTGAGADTVTIATATLKDDAATTTVNEAVSALLETGAGNDKITINTTGTGTTTVNAGEGNDTVTLTADGSGILTVNLGAGNDIFKGAGSVSATDVINGGDGTDTLLLNMVGSANIGAFSNFEAFDAAGLAKTLDVEILAAKNTVTEFVATADVGSAATLINIGAGVGYRVTGDTNVANAMTLTQKTAGALTITLDIDETGTTAATTAATDRDVAVTASNATSIKAVFDSAFVAAATGAGDNATDLNITGTAATTLEVVSGGANALNELDYTTASASGKSVLTSVTVSGDRALDLDLAITGSGTNEVATINASALTGALTFALDDLKATGTLTLGSGDDAITAHTGLAATVSAAADAASAIAAMRAISGIEKGTAENSTIQSNYDVIKLAGAVQAADVAATPTHTVKDGLFTFNGTGPATLDAAVAAVAGVIGANEAVVFEYVGNSYIFAEGATDRGVGDVLIKLTGVTGLNGLDDVNAAGGNLYVF